ncbi:DNA-processing protein DprA (plasmid) [Paracoccus sp. TK19116]|uniref:DNA-processing protein DprA n=1 Tax=Paracoccus albicereus TaxID=2922394 RepID=A0ABT1MNB8_9RHOB|nr:DNA-processing protein DprA [Paracoccus albicereus]MCQ0968943.1 DNA-processing protein DprA [Paracoccus albicereus]
MDTGIFSFGTPKTPPTTKEDDLTCLRLIRSRRVGPTTFYRLIAEHGSLAASLDALPGIAQAAGIEDYAPCSTATAEAELRAGQRAGARLLRFDHPDYPDQLRQIDDAPPVLWLRGDPARLKDQPLAVIGARNASSLGLRMARGMAAALGEAGHVVVSGLARGIDTAAHNASLPTGTVAVMAGGIDVIYPAENAVLAAQIAEKGALLSELPPGTEPMARHFPMRNRIISGLAQAVIVIEAAHRSGSLLTAKNALDQGREVMAVPGHPMDARAAGCNALIRDGATLVRSAQDVIAAVAARTEPATADTRPEPVAKPARPRIDQRELEAAILARLSPSPTEEDLLIRDLGLSAAVLNPAIQALELQGRLTRLAGGRLALT